MRLLFGLLAGLLPLAAAVPYCRDILVRRTKPHRGSFLIWTVLSAIALFSQFYKGATWSLLLPAADGVATLMIFILAVWYGTGGFARRDLIALGLAAIGLMLWYVTREPLVALLITIGVDVIGTVLTAIKTYEAPDSETFSSWLLAALAGLFAAISVGTWSFALLVYPLYIFVANGVVGVIILLRR